MIFFYVTLEVNINTEPQMLPEQFAFQNQTNIKDIFTKVLKGHIAVATTNLKKIILVKKLTLELENI